jgi:hypothetical protein
MRRYVLDSDAIGESGEEQSMSVMISRVYKDAASAIEAVGELEAGGLHCERMIVAITADTRFKGSGSATDHGFDDAPDAKAAPLTLMLHVVTGIALAVLAAVCVVLLAIPGLGAIVAGLIVGGLIQHAMSENTADNANVGRGRTLVTACVPDADRARYQVVLDRSAVSSEAA